MQGGVKADIHISDDEDESGGPRGFEDFDEDEEPEEFRSSSIFASLRYPYFLSIVFGIPIPNNCLI